MPVPFFQVDAFADQPFAGNPAAVCLLDRPASVGWMQAVAAEMNLSETAFLVPRDGGGYDLRWFTPAVEVDLCGHATLASAHALWETGRLAPEDAARFHTASGLLTCRRREDRIAMDFPADPPRQADPVSGVVEALGADPRFTGEGRFDILVHVATEAEVRGLAPDFRALGEVSTRGVIVTAPADADDLDFVSRFFGPAVGIDEDPVTGSAHCCLAPYWAERLGRTTLRARQLSGRGGHVEMRMEGDRVELRGRAVTVIRGELLAEPV